MLAAFATLAFLLAIWLVILAAARTLEESGVKVVSALKGRSILAQPAPAPVTLRYSQRMPARPQPTLRAEPQWRAAA